MEIDFLIRKSDVTSRHNICQIEVKPSSRYTLTSMGKFDRKFHNYLDKSYVLHTKDLEIKDGIIYVPLYMTGLLQNRGKPSHPRRYKNLGSRGP